MKKVIWASLTLALVAGLGQSSFADEGWLVDFKAAKEKAAAEGKDILMEFTGSDWCPPCKRLKAEVLDTEVFKTKAPEQFILLKLDNPRDKSKQTPEEIEQYQKLSAEFKVQGVPTIILADTQGRPFAKMVGFGGQSAEEYVKNLSDQKEVRIKRDEALAAAEKANGIEKAKLLDQAIAVVDAELAVAQYKDVVDQIVALDVNNDAGLKDKYEGMIKLGALREALMEIRRSSASAGPEATLAKIDELISSMSPTGEGLQEVLFQKGALQFRADKAAAKATLEAALKAAPDSQMSRQIQQILATQFKESDPSEAKPGEKKDDK